MPIMAKPLSQLEHCAGIINAVIVFEDDLLFLFITIILFPFMGLKVRSNAGDRILMLKKIDFIIAVSIRAVFFDI